MSSGVSQSEKSSAASYFVQKGNHNPQTAKVTCSSFTTFASLITSNLKTALYYTVDIVSLVDSKCESSYVSVTKIKTKTAQLGEVLLTWMVMIYEALGEAVHTTVYRQ